MISSHRCVRAPGAHAIRGAALPSRLIAIAVIVLALAAGAWWYFTRPGAPPLPGVTTAPTPTATPTSPDAATAAVSDELTVDQLYREARKAMNENRIAGPAGNNALEFYLKILAKQPDDWSPAYAEIGDTVLIASSDAMLYRALAANQGLAPTLADDPAFTAMRSLARPSSQGLLMVNLSSIMRDLEPDLHKWLAGAPITPDDLVNLFGGPNTGLVASGSFDGHIQRGGLFFPLDYERAIRMIKASTSASERK